MRNLPIYFMVLVFAGMLFALSKVHIYTPVVLPAEPEPAPVEQEGFTGRVIMPSLDDIYVLENTAGRDLVQFARFLKGRAAGLHYASAAYFKANQKNLKKDSPHAIMGIKLTLDSLGASSPEILFTNVHDNNFKGLVLSQIQTYWRYPRSESGRFVVWFPIAWETEY
ncbi:hypothetical protein B7988_06245 [Fibrobacter sp. UWB1]|jgi:hypothetical protein|uniref:hypothetical protein n=1 Tax=unclassified Fibrobacter TaxID=2634177 RepID=UPI000B520F61|nr:hypothetical protein [Fibrobacter sp. UWB1]OWV26188.1 hypothetical protein B7988_06245 [Fibrobacter sp. UWB1]